MCPLAFARMPFEPLLRARLAVARGDRGDDRLEVGLGRARARACPSTSAARAPCTDAEAARASACRCCRRSCSPGPRRPPSPCARELYFAGVFASVAGATFASSPWLASASSGGEFSVMKTSAGECEPSWMICAASTPSSSWRTRHGDPRRPSRTPIDERVHGLRVLAAVEGERRLRRRFRPSGGRGEDRADRDQGCECQRSCEDPAHVVAFHSRRASVSNRCCKGNLTRRLRLVASLL